MSKEEIKGEINKVLDQLSDKTLEQLLAMLKNMGSDQTISILDRTTIDKILREDKNLLEKLAK
jgi:hypothetical protein